MTHLTLKLSIRNDGVFAGARRIAPARHNCGSIGKMLGMEEERTESARGDLAGVPADHPGKSGWIKTRVAAEALGVDPRTVRAYIERGDLVARSEGEGIQKTYLVSIDSVYALRDRRGSSAKKTRMTGAGRRVPSARNASTAGASGPTAGHSGGVPAEDLADVIRELAAETARMSAEAAEFRTRLELTAQAESTLRETLERERERADRLEEELTTLRDARNPSPAPQGAPERVTETTADTDTAADRGSPETGVHRRSWWRRFFGFE